MVLCLSLLMVAPLQAHAATPPHLVACDGSENLMVQHYATGEDDGKTFITGPYDICFSGTSYAGTGDLGISPLTGVTLIYYSWNNSDDGWLRLYKEPGGGGSWENMNPAEYMSSPDGSFLLTQMCLSCGARPDNNP